MFDLRDFDIQQKLNSLTKYPPIPTFHEINIKTGMLDGSKPLDFKGQLAQVTEKIDGTNGRIVVFPDGKFVIGSRENLLACSEDWFLNPELGIVKELWGTATELASMATLTDGIGVRVYFFEVYGGKINGWKNYTKSEKFGHRLFDVIEFRDEQFIEQMYRTREDIASWRQHGGQPFVGWDRMLEVAQETNLQRVPTIEHGMDPQGVAFEGLENTLETLEDWFPGGSAAVLESGVQGRPEGVVFKSLDGGSRAKLRFQDYESTIKRLEAARVREAAKALRDVE